MAVNFEDQVLNFIKAQNFGGSKLGVGRLSIVSKQSGNEDLARALSKISGAKDTTEKLNSVGQKVLKNIEEIAAKAITSDGRSQKAMLRQIASMEQLLPLVSENTKQQKAAKVELVNFIRSTQKGLSKNSRFGNRFTEMLRGALPILGGVASGIASRNPLLGAAVGFGVNRFQKYQENKQEEKDNLAKDLIESLKEFPEEQKKEREERKKRKEKKKKEDEKKLKDQEKLAKDTEKEKSPKKSSVEKEFIESAVKGMEAELEDAMNGSMAPILKEIFGTSHATMTTVEKIEKLIKATMPSEEVERENDTFRGKQLALMEKLADNSEKALEGQSNMAEEIKSQGDGSFTGNWLLDLILVKSGLGGFLKSFSWLKGPLAKLGGFFTGVGRLMMRLPGAGLVAKAAAGIGKMGGVLAGMLGAVGGMASKSIKLMFKGLGKLISFPVMFVAGVAKGLYDGVSSYLEGAPLSEAALQGLKGFADFFLLGQLQRIQDWLSDSRILDSIFESFSGTDENSKVLKSTLLEANNKIVNGVIDIMAVPGEFQASSVDRVKREAKEAYNSLPGLINSINEHAENVGDGIRGLSGNSKGFVASKLKGVDESIKEFFLGMIPDWIPSWAFPSSIAQDIKTARGGTDSRGIQLNSSFMSSTFPSFPMGRGIGVDQPTSAPQRTPSPTASTRTQSTPAPSLKTPSKRTSSSESKSTEQVIDDILRREGGFVNNPNDKGGPTNMGITQGTLSGWLGRQATVDDVRNLTEETAREIYRKEYITPFDKIEDQALRELAIDSGVNHGPGRAARWVKEGEAKGLTGQALYDDVVNTRKTFYDDIVAADPTQREFYAGWMNRLDEFRGKTSGAPTMDTESPQKSIRADAMRAADTQANEAAAASVRSTSSSQQINSSNVVNNNNTSVMNKRRPINEEPSVVRFMTPLLA
jgi:lysozyme family protein